MNQYKKGFTILELLVVIAIIGILASIVMVAVGNSRDKAADKAIVQNLLSVRSEAALYFSTAGTYGTYGTAAGIYTANGKCPLATYSPAVPYGNSIFRDSSDEGSSGPKFSRSNVITKAFNDANTRSGGNVTATRYGNTRCYSTGTEWAAMVQLKTDATKSWCVDSNGASKQVASGVGMISGFDVTVGARCGS